jgi:hypothetical protein
MSTVPEGDFNKVELIKTVLIKNKRTKNEERESVFLVLRSD